MVHLFEMNDPDADMQIWWQLKGNNFFEKWEHKKRNFVRKKFVSPEGNKIFRNGVFR